MLYNLSPESFKTQNALMQEKNKNKNKNKRNSNFMQGEDHPVRHANSKPSSREKCYTFHLFNLFLRRAMRRFNHINQIRTR